MQTMERIATARHVDGRSFWVATASGHGLVVEGKPDEPRPTSGPGPMELMLVSLATCAGSTMRDILTGMRQPFRRLVVRVWGERAPEPPRVWTRIRLLYQVAGEVVPHRLERAERLTDTRYCSASVMLSQVAELETVTDLIREVDPEVTRELRRRILRPHQSLTELVDPGEEDPSTVFFAARRGGEVVGTAGLYREPEPDGDANARRVRAMATAPEVRGEGVGELLLDACVDRARRDGASTVWCNARTGARGFYERYGFRVVSDPFDVAGIGPHVRMEKTLGPVA